MPDSKSYSFRSVSAVRKPIMRILGYSFATLFVPSAIAWMLLSPAMPFRWEPQLAPARIASSPPGREGLVTAARPLLTQVAVGDPLGIAIHWQRPDGPIEEDFGLGDRNRIRRFWPRASVNAMTFAVTSPSGEEFEGSVELNPERAGDGRGLYNEPTLFFELDRDGIDVIDPGERGANGPLRNRAKWRGDAVLDCDALGLYTVRISGQILREKAPPIAFSSEPVAMERVAGINSLDTIRRKAKVAAVAIWWRWHWIIIGSDPIADDAEGHRHVRFRGTRSERDKWSQWFGHMALRADGAVVSVSDGFGDTCVAVGTFVETPDGECPIEDLSVGDSVVGYDTDRRRRVVTRVRAIHLGMAAQTIRLGKALRVTREHPVWANGAWTRAEDIVAGDRLLGKDGMPVTVSSIELIPIAIDVVDLTVDAPHNFFAGGMLVHNKKVVYSPGLHDAWYRLPDVDP